ncbi:MaoC family dehydratase [Alkalisalibacterium limincola]|uniref:MaoC family dehydratase n=2 Tax=Alkalisalibacterium limincola TaxID=2699169 RepID=A0A5C8KVF3_9GAMM|nr:MaoC family dehydratase [Alkalisalibacterium limincola]
MNVNNDPYLSRGAIKVVEITADDIQRFVELSGDRNPIHSDEFIARKSIFGKRIAPGMMVASYISAVIANDLPGPGAIYLQQELKFEAPVFIGDRITVMARVIETPRPGRLVLETTCTNQEAVVVISGKALVKTPQGFEVHG